MERSKEVHERNQQINAISDFCHWHFFAVVCAKYNLDLMNKFTEHLRQILEYSKEEAVRLKNNQIRPEHFVLGILRDGNSIAVQALLRQGVNLDDLKGILNGIYTNIGL